MKADDNEKVVKGVLRRRSDAPLSILYQNPFEAEPGNRDPAYKLMIPCGLSDVLAEILFSRSFDFSVIPTGGWNRVSSA